MYLHLRRGKVESSMGGPTSSATSILCRIFLIHKYKVARITIGCVDDQSN
jgi:hypothetical protein